MRRRSIASSRGLTMIEIIVAVGVLAMVAVLMHGVIDSLSRGKKGEALRAERSHQGREALQRIVRDLSSAYLSMHVPTNTSLITQKTAFVGRGSSHRIDFTAFAHVRTDRDAHESDQAEVGYFMVKNPEFPEKRDLARREQTPIDFDPLKGGIVNVVAEDVDQFEFKFLDPTTGLWVDNWDSTQVSGQPNRLPLEVEIKLVLNGVGEGAPYAYTTKLFLPIQQPLSFGIPK